MIFKGKSNEFLQLDNIQKPNCKLLNERITDSLTILWNIHETACLNIDGKDYHLDKNHLIFLTEFHNAKVKQVQEVRLIRFNRPFYCIINHDSEIGCKGILFFGASSVPIIQIPLEELEKFETLWKMFSIEMKSKKDNLQIEMLQMMLKRLLILCTRLKKEQTDSLDLDKPQIDLVREFNYLVETNFKTKHTVSEYADMLHKSPKTLSNLFAKYNQKTPLQIIQERILLETQRLLLYTNQDISEIAYSIGFDTIQSFSRFFKNKIGMSPTHFREQGKTANP